MNPVKDFMDVMRQLETAATALCRAHQRHLPHYARNPHSSFLLHLTETIGRCNSQLTPFYRFIDATHQLQSVEGLEVRKRVALNLMVKAKQELDNILGNMTAYGDIPPASSDPVAQAALAKLDASISTLRADLPGSSQGAMGGAGTHRAPTPPIRSPVASGARRISVGDRAGTSGVTLPPYGTLRAQSLQNFLNMVAQLHGAAESFNKICRVQFDSILPTDVNAHTIVNGLRAYPAKIGRQINGLRSLQQRIQVQSCHEAHEDRRSALNVAKEIQDDFRQHLGLLASLMSLRRLPQEASPSVTLMQTKIPQLTEFVRRINGWQ